MKTTSRRAFLHRSLGLTAAALTGTSGLPEALAADVPDDDPAFAGGERLRALPFVGEGKQAVSRLKGEGLAGRLAFDLRRLESDRMIVDNDDFFIRTRQPGRLDLERRRPWTIRVGGLVRQETALVLDDLERRRRPQGVVLAECSGNGGHRAFGLLSAAEWHGIPIGEVLERLPIDRRATRVLIAGFDEHSVGGPEEGASWIFTFDELEHAGAFLATRMNGVPLPVDHGFPVRLVVPGWYGCSWAKWVERIELVDESAPSTAQMRDYASRTHQDGTPPLARDFRPAAMDPAAMPIRIEKWRVEGGVAYRVVGILWGGVGQAIDGVRIGFRRSSGESSVSALAVTRGAETRTWTLWTHAWRPPAPGRYTVRLRLADRGIRTRRLDTGYYERQVDIDEV